MIIGALFFLQFMIINSSKYIFVIWYNLGDQIGLPVLRDPMTLEKVNISSAKDPFHFDVTWIMNLSLKNWMQCINISCFFLANFCYQKQIFFSFLYYGFITFIYFQLLGGFWCHFICWHLKCVMKKKTCLFQYFV